MAVLIAIIGIVGLFVGLTIYGTLVGAFVLSALWGWFITPLFGTPVPPLPMVAGLSLAIRYVASHTESQYEDHKIAWTPNVVTGLVSPWVVLFGGWLIHSWAGG